MSPMAWMRRLKKLVSLRGLFLLLGVIAVVLLVWFGGPLLGIAEWKPLASVGGRVIFLLVIVVGVMAHGLWKAKKQRSDNEKVVSEMMANTEEDELLKEEVNSQRERMRRAISLVRRWRPGRFRSVYDLPWYMIIGVPGSGKSTALLNSGLEFPLKEEMGIDSVKGVGGTQNCDWWFTNKAVIIDTAGRYTSQESNDKRDSRGWESFLGLLKKYRPRQPINGVILSVSVAELLEQTPTERMLHARALKQRVQELKNRLGLVFPVYMVLTKLDLLEGFNDTFGMLSEQEREDVFGMTFELESVHDTESLTASFEKEFDALLERLSHFLLHRVQQERTLDATRRIYQFPKQVALLRAPVWTLIKEVFCPSAYEEVPVLRGIYMVSAEQSGKAHDKVSRMVDDQFGLVMPEGRTPAAARQQEGFFLRQLFENIIFSEYGLATVDGIRKRRFRWLQRGALAGLVLFVGGVGVAWTFSYQWNAELIQVYEKDLGQLQGDLEKAPQNWVELEHLLSDAMAMPGVSGTSMPEGGPRRVGLFQGNELGQVAEGAYGRLLQHHLGSTLKEALEVELRENLDNLEYLYETLKTYLMLNRRQHMDRDQVRAWLSALLSREVPGQVNERVRRNMITHLENYLALNHRLPTESKLVGKARSSLTSMPLDERAYQRIQMDAADSGFPSFRLPLVLGSVAERVFERRSGTSMRKGIPGLYTLNGYKGLFKPEKDRVVGRLLEDSWVYGEDAEDFRNLDETAIKTGVENRYFRDYAHRWREFLKDLRIQPYDNAEEGARIAGLLAGPEAPISRLMEAVEYNTQLSVTEEDGATDALGDAAKEQAGRAADRASGRGPRLSSLVPSSAAEEEEPTTFVDETFKPLNDVRKDTFQALRDNADIMADYLEEGGAEVSREAFNQAVSEFRSTVNDTDSDLLAGMVAGFVGDSQSLARASETQTLNEVWRNQVYGEYRQAISGKYPINLDADEEIALQDFENFFGPGGTLDQFVAAHLADHIDMSQSPWRLEGDLSIRSRTLRLLEDAKRIQEAFFTSGGEGLAVNFSLAPLSLDSGITRMMVRMDDRSLVYRHGPSRNINFRWPVDNRSGDTRIALTPGDASRAPAQHTYPGAWSLFRMLQDTGGLDGSGRKRELALNLDDYSASLQLTADSIKHPFNRAMFKDFWLPSTL